jgi:hypothetical protein
MTELVSSKLERSLLIRIDGLTTNRSDFIRQAVAEKVRRAGRKGQSAWDALQGTKGLHITIRAPRGKVKRIDL